MFNQKVNGNLSQNPEYLNSSYTFINPKDIHNCGTTINKYIKASNSSSLPLQTWSSANVAVESFGMRPIVNPREYFDQLNKYLGTIVYTDSVNLKKSGLSSEHYYLFNEISTEPDNSFIQAIKGEVVDKLNYYMGASTDQIGMFKEYNPLCEGFVITDVDITTYRSKQNDNHFLHKILFSAFNTTRYNTVSFRADVYQDTTPMMEEWNTAINLISNSRQPTNTSSKSEIYVALITLMNNTTCVTGQESECEYRGYNLDSKFSQLLNENFLKPVKGLFWQQPDSMLQNIYNTGGNYDEDGQIRIIDYGPGNLNELIKKLI
jgi:hypothetical protein